MSVKIRPYRRGGWEVDIMFRFADGTPHRERRKAPMQSKSAALRWGQDRERYLLQHGVVNSNGGRGRPERKEVPTVAEFAPRYIEGYSKANRHKPSTVDAKESVLRNHLVPAVGDLRLDQIRPEHVQRIKANLVERSPKTVNNVLTVLSTLLKAAVEWGLVEEAPVRVKLLKVSQVDVEFYDFEDFEALVSAAQKVDPRVHLVVLLGGEAGLRRGEMIALEWTDIDFKRGEHGVLTVARSVWKAHTTLPKGNRIRRVPLTATLASALRAHRHLQGPRALYRDDGEPITAKVVRRWLNRAQRLANLKDKGPHTLRHTFCSHLAMRGAPARAIQELAGHANLSTTQRYMHLSPAALVQAIGLLDRKEDRPESSPFGDILETGRR